MAYALRELQERVHAKYPRIYPDRLIRTVRRRIKIYRAATARELMFGSFANSERPAEVADAQLRRLEMGQSLREPCH